MAEYRLRSKARSDIDAIWDYTVQSWGVQQALHYLNGLRDVCTELADNPELGKCRDELYKGLRVYPYGTWSFISLLKTVSMLSASCTGAWMFSAI
ncbi:MAG TPA: type II toxin-antitoxin system RelE/ParE family toxin [Gammaproteobacteria bacterium]|nr:type II toxin-antitoxin system RelE/ParE family toxin [Gammaproteobacteria bacterium]